ncbi:MAG: pyruvate dehydrogenase complex E1 component subunit beta [Pseudomonadota bacterium]
MTVEEVPYREAVRRALRDAMEADDAVVLIGEEVGRYGGAYGASKGLIDEFGEHRVLDAPISEAGIAGVAVGAAMAGLRPVAELMYVDFAGLAMDQIGNQAAKIRYMFGGQIGVPMVLRTQGGTGRSAAAQHSQSLEAWFAHIPGLRVAMPGSVADAYHLLRDALRRPDPVVVIEHKGLYAGKGPLDPAAPPAPWGRAAVLRQGADLCLVAWSGMVRHALTAADALARQGVEATVVDLRTLNPLDLSAAVEATARAGRAMVVSEAPLTGGFASEVAARLTEEAFDHLEEPVLRLCAEDVPVPVAPALERATIPDAASIEAAALRLLRRR